MNAYEKHSANILNRVLHRVRYTSPINIVLRVLPPFTHATIRNIHYRIIQPGLSSFQEELLAIIGGHSSSKSVIVFPPSLDWSSQLFQRPQQIATALAEKDILVFYVQYRENWNDTPFKQIQSNLYLCSVPLETFRCVDEALIYLFTWNSSFKTAFKSPRIIYDYVDDIGVFPGSYTRLQRNHQQLLQDAEFVLTTARRLHDNVLPIRPDAVLCPNGVDFEHFTNARLAGVETPPVDMRPILSIGKPIIGYHGAFAKWFDYDLIECVSKARQDLSFVLIGPDHDNTLPISLIKQSNVHWLGKKSYQALPDYLRYFDVATIPFRLTEITYATSPIKLFEYFAAGKPVVLTAMQESMQYPGVLVSNSCQDFIDMLDRALKLRNDPQYLELSERIARQNTWGVRARQIVDVIAQ